MSKIYTQNNTCNNSFSISPLPNVFFTSSWLICEFFKPCFHKEWTLNVLYCILRVMHNKSLRANGSVQSSCQRLHASNGAEVERCCCHISHRHALKIVPACKIQHKALMCTSGLWMTGQDFVSFSRQCKPSQTSLRQHFTFYCIHSQGKFFFWYVLLIFIGPERYIKICIWLELLFSASVRWFVHIICLWDAAKLTHRNTKQQQSKPFGNLVTYTSFCSLFFLRALH